jgi:hypothetical protein
MAYLIDTVMMSARTHLNDDSAINWPDPNLLPKLQEAFRDLRLELELNGIQVIDEVSADLTVPTNTTDLSTVTNYPTDMITPIWMKEKQVGETDAFLISMTPIDFIPNVDQDITLNWWSWQMNTIKLLGALNPVVVQLRYRRDLLVPKLNSDSLSVIMGESYLSYRTAAIAFASVKDFASADRMDARAEMNKGKLIQFFTNYEKQLLPAKRQPYHRRNWFKNAIRSI